MRTFKLRAQLLFASGYFSYSQVSTKVLNSTCNCLDSLLKDKRNKIDFQFGLENCISRSYQGSLVFKTSDSTELFLSNLEDQLKKNCESFNQCQGILNKMTMEKTESNIKEPKICEIMRVGDFEDLSGTERVVVSMRDSIQIVTFEKTKFYTKSKIIWKDDCSFRVIFIRSSNPYEKLMLKPGDERLTRIIDIKNGKDIIFETGIFGKWFLGRLTKI